MQLLASKQFDPVTTLKRDLDSVVSRLCPLTKLITTMIPISRNFSARIHPRPARLIRPTRCQVKGNRLSSIPGFHMLRSSLPLLYLFID